MFYIALAGFWSKEEILAYSWEYRPVLFYLVMITVFFTAFYIFRVLFLTFSGEYRGRNREHLHESPPAMIIPMAMLAFMALIGGFVGVSRFLGGEEQERVLSFSIPAFLQVLDELWLLGHHPLLNQ